ncbi:MAG: 7-cyano-7-deazaguanine synthase QueC [Pseudobdellovibrionaceae bacterium]
MKSVVLLSGGLDSSVNLYEALRASTVVCTLTFDYGQRAAKKEIECAKDLSQKNKVDHRVVALPFFKDFTKTSLVNTLMEVPTGSIIEIDDKAASQSSATKVWVPNRNGILLNVAAGFAEGLGADVVVPGFNKEEAATFPDNSNAYLKSLDQCFSFSTENSVRTWCPTVEMDKTQIVARGIVLKVDFKDLWPCYFSEAKWCGQCESCLRYKRALTANNLDLASNFLN